MLLDSMIPEARETSRRVAGLATGLAPSVCVAEQRERVASELCYGSINPSPRASATATERELTPSLRYTAIAWVFTVLRDTKSSSAIASKLRCVGR
jgi:hypothetical protein